MYAIRRATAADAGVLARHRAEMFRDMSELPDDLYDTLVEAARAYFAAAIVDGRYVGWVAELDDPSGAIVAGAGLQLRDLLPRPDVARETEHARAGRGGRIRAKLNGLADCTVIGALYRASQAGVDVDLVVRGICMLRPGIPGLSGRIRVVSVLGRFLEHARIYHFANAGAPEYYLGSADWRPRNLRRRVEVVTPVDDAAARARIDRILERELVEPGAWRLESDGSYTRSPAAS